MFKSLMARYYRPTYQRLLDKILSGDVLHVDETEVKLRTGKGYVWVFTNLEEVVFMYRPTREGDFLQELLKDFHGVLVSDFYAAYDSLDCPQQKCLIHLMRDMNQELLNNPFDEELQSVTGPFGILLRADRRHHRPARAEAAAPEASTSGTWTGSSESLAAPDLPLRGRRGPAGAAAQVPGQAVHLPRARRRAVEQQQRRERHQAVRLLPGGHTQGG